MVHGFRREDNSLHVYSTHCVLELENACSPQLCQCWFFVQRMDVMPLLTFYKQHRQLTTSGGCYDMHVTGLKSTVS